MNDKIIAGIILFAILVIYLDEYSSGQVTLNRGANRISYSPNSAIADVKAV